MTNARRTARRLFVAASLSVVVLSLVTSVAVANHDSPGDWTVQPANPPEDARPGYESASFIHWAQGGDDFRGDGLREVHHIEMISEDLGFGDCTLFAVDAFGIDRGDTHDGTETDENLATHVKNYDFAQDRMWMEMYSGNDAGGDPIHLNASDQFVAHQTDCYTNPDTAGWYQIEGWANGTAWDGQFDEARLFSHYFWICDCQNESEARERLGPPPSEASTTPTPTPAGTPLPDDGGTPTPTSAGAATTATPGDEADATTPTPTPDDSAGDAADDATPTGTEADDGPTEPTPGDGPGFGVFAALAALLGSFFLLRRR